MVGKLGVAVIGAGYWGPNLVRNVALNSETELRWVCDLDAAKAERLADTYSGAGATSDLRRLLDDPAVHAVAIATPAWTHAGVAIDAMRAGKHVLIEKPLAPSVAEAERVISVAKETDRVVMCDHTYCYTPAVQHIAGMLRDGALGELYYIDSIRINLGLVQPDVDVMWDLAPHDLSIIDHVLPEGVHVQTVAAHGADPIGAGHACVAYLLLGLSNGAIAHVHVNWLSPTKVRTMTIGGSAGTVVWDDLSPTQRISVYDRGIDLAAAGDDEVRHRNQVAYRIGDMVAPALPDREALSSVITEWVSAIRGNREPITGASSGLRVLGILEAAATSLADNGRTVHLPAALAEVA